MSDHQNHPRPDVLFGGAVKDMSFFLRRGGVSYQLYKVDSWKYKKTKEELLFKDEKIQSKKKRIPDQLTICRLDIDWLNFNKQFDVRKGPANEGYSNYYLPVCPDGVLQVKEYEMVTYQNIYDGIDLVWYEKDGFLKYDYIVKKDGNYKQIQLQVQGAEKTWINDKRELVIKTPLGCIIEQAPLVIQGNRVCKARWVVNATVVSFEIEDLVPGQVFVIDPGVRTWGTYYGGAWYEWSNGTCTDKDANVYMAGDAGFYTNTIVATIGTIQVSNQGLCAFLAKFNTAGQRLWSTYYAGGLTLTDNGVFCSSDKDGNIYLAGTTNFSVAVATSAGHQQNYGGGGTDAFLAKFDASGTRLWGTYYGGSVTDEGCACITDFSGNVYLTGFTNSSNNISSAGSHQPGFAGGNYDGFLVKFSSSGQQQWATYYGGNGTDIAYGCATDLSGDIYLTGFSYTNGGTNIATPGSHQPSLYGGNGGQDAFLAKFNSAGQRQWGTYYGGGGYDFGYACTVDVSGNIYMTGACASNNGTSIATPGSHQPVYAGGVWDGFLAKFNSGGIRQWATYYGSTGFDGISSCAMDKDDNIYIVGTTDTNAGNVFATAGTQQNALNGSNDTFLAAFGPNGQRHWGTYYGGPADDRGSGCSVDTIGNIYVCGRVEVENGNSLATASSHQTSFGGISDGFLAQFNNCITPSVTNPSPDLDLSVSSKSLCSGQIVSLSISGASSYTWMPGGIVSSSFSVIAATDLNYTVTGLDNQGCKNKLSVNIPVIPTPTLTVTPFFYLCSGNASLSVSGAEAFLWSPGNMSGASVVVSPGITTNYTVLGANSNCTSSAVSIVSVGVAPPFLISASDYSGCQGSCFSFSNSVSSFYPYSYFWGDSTEAIPLLTSHCYTASGKFNVIAEATYSTGCHVTSTDTLTITIFPLPVPDFNINNGDLINTNTSIFFRNVSEGAQKFKWHFSEDTTSSDYLSTIDVHRRYSTPGNYCVKLVAIDTVFGCVDSLTKCMDVLCLTEITIPNIFTPNNDGINDVFQFETNCVKSLTCRIFNRWEGEIYSWNGLTGGWDGKTTSKVPVSDGVYFFILEYVEENNAIVKRVGSVTILR